MDDGRTAPGRHHSRYGHHLAEQALGPFDQPDDAAVVGRLQPGQQGGPVPHPGVARNGAHPGEGDEMPYGPGNGVFVQQRIGVQSHDHFPVAHGQGQVQPLGLAQVLVQLQHPQFGILRLQPVQDLLGPVRAGVVDHNHFQVLVPAFVDGMDGFCNGRLFVMGRDEHRDQGRAGKGRGNL